MDCPQPFVPTLPRSANTLLARKKQKPLTAVCNLQNGQFRYLGIEEHLKKKIDAGLHSKEPFGSKYQQIKEAKPETSTLLTLMLNIGVCLFKSSSLRRACGRF